MNNNDGIGDDDDDDDGDDSEKEETEKEEEGTTAATSNNNNNNNNNEKDDSSVSFYDQFCLQPPSATSYPHEVLPIAILQSPLLSTCAVDRSYAARTIYHGLRSGGCGRMVVHLPQVYSLTDTLEMMYDQLTRQQQLYSHVHANRKRLKRTSTTGVQDMIFDVLLKSISTGGNNNGSIVILIENITAAPTTTIQYHQFLQTMTTWRSLYGIPVSILLIESSSSSTRRSINLTGGGGGGGRYGHRTMYWKDPAHEYAEAATVWCRHFTAALTKTTDDDDGGGVLPLPSDIRSLIKDSLTDTMSLTAFTERIKRCLVTFYSHRGSFVFASLKSHPAFCCWFVTYPKSKSMLCGESENGVSTYDRSKRILKCYEDLHNQCGTLHFWFTLLCTVLPLQVWVSTTTVSTSTTTTSTTTITAKQQHQQQQTQTQTCNVLLQCLANTYQVLTTTTTTKRTTTAKLDDVDNHALKIIRRYLQRGVGDSCEEEEVVVEEEKDGKNKKNDYDDDCGRPDETFAKKQVTKMVRELIVLIDTVDTKATTTTINAAATKNHPNNDDRINNRQHNYHHRRQQQQQQQRQQDWDGIRTTMEEMNTIITTEYRNSLRRWVDDNPLMGWMDDDDVEEMMVMTMNGGGGSSSSSRSPLVNIRRSTVDSLRPSTKRLYSVIEDQLSIYCDDWCRLFDGPVEEFWTGIYELQSCGLIRESSTSTTSTTTTGTTMMRTKSSSSSSSKRRIVYEKVTVVWC
jgi:hypothetical protein